jgi:integrase
LDRTAERGGQFIRCHRGSQLCDQCNSSAGRRELAGRAAEAERRRRGKIRRSNFNVIWSAACTAAGIPDAHFHDLRHTGGTLAATTGATPKELMTRLGHSSTRAAMIYQHATRDRDKAIAQALGTLADKARNGS